MARYDILTEKEFSKHEVHYRIIEHIEIYRKSKELKKKEMKILDWGCGKGGDVLWMLEKGYNVYGVEIDMEVMNKGMELFRKKGCDPSRLRLLSPSGKTDFPDNFFDFTFSDQVFEHISNLESVAAELGRVTAKEGAGLHIYPAHKYLVEGHLYMPFVHWLPKNILRKYLIALYVTLGKEPKWKELQNISEKINGYYRYSIDQTFYAGSISR